MSKTVRCKFRVDEITQTAQNGARVVLTAVTSGSDENKAFFKWTPSGRIEFQTVNEEAAKQFELGKEYYLDFTPAG